MRHGYYAMAALLYASALAFIYAAVSVAPNMTFPSTDSETAAAMLLCIGLAAKLLGHCFLLLRPRAW